VAEAGGSTRRLSERLPQMPRDDSGSAAGAFWARKAVPRARPALKPNPARSLWRRRIVSHHP
jgi:hypothetical protein